MELAHNWADWQATKRHYELMSRYVAPHFQGLNSLRQASYNYSFRIEMFLWESRSCRAVSY